MKEIILAIHNNHSENRGSPPQVTNNQPDKYHGYFENEYGEQWIFTYDRNAKKGELCGGDVGWEAIYEVVNGHVIELIFNQPEIKWLQACWKAATAYQK